MKSYSSISILFGLVLAFDISGCGSPSGQSSQNGAATVNTTSGVQGGTGSLGSGGGSLGDGSNGSNPAGSGGTSNAGNNPGTPISGGPTNPCPDGVSCPVDPVPPPVQVPPPSLNFTVNADQFQNSHSVSKFVSPNGNGIKNIYDGSWVEYDQIDFGNWAQSFNADVMIEPNSNGAVVEMHLDSADGPVAAQMSLPGSGPKKYVSTTTGLSATGIHDIFLVFHSTYHHQLIGQMDTFSINGDPSAMDSLPLTIDSQKFADSHGVGKFSEKKAQGITNLASNHWVMYRGIRLEDVGNISVDAMVPKRADGSKIEVHFDSPTGPIVATIDLSASPKDFQTFTGSVAPNSGIHDLYFVFTTPHSGTSAGKISQISLD